MGDVVGILDEDGIAQAGEARDKGPGGFGLSHDETRWRQGGEQTRGGVAEATKRAASVYVFVGSRWGDPGKRGVDVDVDVMCVEGDGWETDSWNANRIYQGGCEWGEEAMMTIQISGSDDCSVLLLLCTRLLLVALLKEPMVSMTATERKRHTDTHDCEVISAFGCVLVDE